MKIIAGLGNPGQEYAATKHNIGFRFLDALASQLDIGSWQNKYDALVAEGKIGTEKVLLAKPLTYMNDSGKALQPLLHWYKLTVQDLIVVHDDMDIPLGTVRLRTKGSAGGHNGLKSILYHLGDEHFARVRIGIGHPLPNRTVVNYVLTPFSKDEQIAMDAAIRYLLPAVSCMVTEGTDKAMNKYNPSRKKNHDAADKAGAEA